MNEDEIFEKLKGMISEQFGIEEEIITKDSTLADDLKADSLDIVEFVMDIEENFDIEISDEDAEKIHTVGDVIDYILSKQ